MLVRFAVKNFMSFRDMTEFNMLAGDVRRHKNHVKKIGDVEILRAAAIYGANASGKSNVFNVMHFLSGFIFQDIPIEELYIRRFALDESARAEAQEFEVELVIENRFFIYRLVIMSFVVAQETIYETFPNSKKEDVLIYNRDTLMGTFDIKNEYSKSDKDKLRIEVIKEEVITKGKSGLKNFSKRGYGDIDIVFNWFESLIFINPEISIKNIADLVYNDNNLKDFLIENLRVSDVGITDFLYNDLSLEMYYGENEKDKISQVRSALNNGLKSIPIFEGFERGIVIGENGSETVKMLNIMHVGKDKNFLPLTYESLGTRRFLDILPAFYTLLKFESPVFIDEIESSVHPLYIKELLKKTMANPDIKGQLIFTSHESNLLDLDIFRQDEIWFTKKDNEGCTHIYSLSDFKPRYDFDIKNGYLTGRFGGIPFLGKLEDLDWNTLKAN